MPADDRRTPFLSRRNKRGKAGFGFTNLQCFHFSTLVTSRGHFMSIKLLTRPACKAERGLQALASKP